MKKVFGLVLAFCMAFSMFACGTTGASKSSGTESAAGASSGKLNYPTKPISLLVSWGAGGGTDLMARAIASDSKTYLGANMSVVNREGAGGTIGFTEATKYAKDGYSLVYATSGIFSAQPLLRKVQYSIDDFDFICGLTEDVVGLYVSSDLGVKTMDELIQKYKDGGLVLGTNGSAGSIPAFGADTLIPMLGVKKSTVVNYDGTAKVLPALLGKEINVAMMHPNEAYSNAKAGSIVCLGLACKERLKNFPDYPTLKEQGIDWECSITKGIVAPKGLDPQIRGYLEQNIMKLVEGENFQKYAKNNNIQMKVTSGADFEEGVRQQLADFETARKTASSK